LKPNALAVYLDRPDHELDADRGFVELVVRVVGEPLKQSALPHALSGQDYLDRRPQ
jgi:hypothetical protein